MVTATLAYPDDVDGWRNALRGLVQAGIAPADVVWQVAGEGGDLLGGAARTGTDRGGVQRPQGVPRGRAAGDLQSHDPERFALLHELLLRVRETPGLMADTADRLVHRIGALDKSVRHDVHKMRAFVRFREVADEGGERFAAWFEPEHYIVRLNAPFFVRRFTAMRWSILTPEVCAHWDLDSLEYTPGARRAEAPGGDPLEATWTTYYASIFNPARLKVKAMTSEMPKKYWKNLPEAALVRG